VHRGLFELLNCPIISIVDDDLSVREATEALVRSLGYTAVSFASAEEYLQSGRVRDSSCLITDLQMPGMNGADLQDRLLADGYRTPVIVITGFCEEKARRRMLEAGAFGFLRKPFEDESLIRCLEKALEGFETAGQ
jgi:FixJ family two-component response regulator